MSSLRIPNQQFLFWDFGDRYGFEAGAEPIRRRQSGSAGEKLGTPFGPTSHRIEQSRFVLMQPIFF